MSPRPTIKPAAIAAAEPVALLSAVRAAVYAFLISRHVDTATVGVVVAVGEVVFAYLTRRLVTPVKRAESRVQKARRQVRATAKKAAPHADPTAPAGGPASAPAAVTSTPTL